MNEQSLILLLTTAGVAFIHTILGPDHYIPFIALAKAGNWSKEKTIRIIILSGLGHTLSSILLGLAGILFGFALNQIEDIEIFRGDIVGWLFICFGIIYLVWGIRKIHKKHSHFHIHENSKGTSYLHFHKNNAEHIHTKNKEGTFTPWIIFILFVFGPCEPLIPLVMYPSVSGNILMTVLVSSVFIVITIITMLLIVVTGLKGLKLFNISYFEKYSHAAAGALILVCGLLIKIFGL